MKADQENTEEEAENPEANYEDTLDNSVDQGSSDTSALENRHQKGKRQRIRNRNRRGEADSLSSGHKEESESTW